jgi:hypothetical protein
MAAIRPSWKGGLRLLPHVHEHRFAARLRRRNRQAADRQSGGFVDNKREPANKSPARDLGIAVELDPNALADRSHGHHALEGLIGTDSIVVGSWCARSLWAQPVSVRRSPLSSQSARASRSPAAGSARSADLSVSYRVSRSQRLSATWRSANSCSGRPSKSAVSPIRRKAVEARVATGS